jgi:hypothetical protein
MFSIGWTTAFSQFVDLLPRRILTSAMQQIIRVAAYERVGSMNRARADFRQSRRNEPLRGLHARHLGRNLSSLELIQEIGPCLHHPAPLDQALRPVVRGPHLVAFGVSELQ